MKMSVCMCDYCIQELRSRGEEIYVGNYAYEDRKCYWCNEEDVDTHYVTMSD